MNIENKKNISKVVKREIILTIISVVVLVSFFSLFTYAFFMDIKETDVNVLNYGDLTLEFCVDVSCDSNIENIGRTIGTDENGDPVSMYPQSELEALENVPYIFKVTNTGDYKQTIKIKLMKKENPELHSNYSDYRELDLQYLNLSFSELGLEVQTMPYQEFDGILDTIVLEPNEERIYNLWLWIKEDAPNSIQGSYFIADISLTGEYEVERGTLTQTILADNNPQSDVNIDFAYTSNGCNTSTACSAGTVVNQNQVTNGLYYTSDTSKTENGEVVYYYRGAVTNNYLVFGNYCWRIVRTVEDGSVRLRYGGAATKSGNTYTCPQTGTAVNIGSSVYNLNMNSINSVNYKTSDIKTVVENWYRDNIWKNGQNIGVTNLIEDSPYCNDMSEDMWENWCRYFGFYGRMLSDGNTNPQYKCPSSADAYTVAKGDLTYPVGLLTADEVAYAGVANRGSNSSYYLNTGEDYWTMTPYDASDYYSSASVIKVSSDGRFVFSDATFAVVPVISIKSEATVKRGTGVYNDPYVINTD